MGRVGHLFRIAQLAVGSWSKVVLGEYFGRPWVFLVYSVISLAVTTWLIIAALRAPAVELWPGPHALAGHAVMAFRDRFSRLRHLADGP